jgi:PTH1 family peptidyl-tRNA hydrolase
MSTYPIQLIAGLANPGKEYAKSRHNAGAWLIDALLKRESLPPLKAETRFHGFVSSWSLASEKCWLFVPGTYMNDSGLAIRAFANFYRIPPQSILIVHDELDLLPGVCRFKQGGGDGGHNGLKDIAQHLQSKEFWRLRLGIGHPGQRDHVHDYVLNAPSIADRKKIATAIDRALDTLSTFVQGNQQPALQILHTQEE